MEQLTKKEDKKKTLKGTLRKNIESILALEKESMKELSTVQHIAEKVNAFAGSTPFIVFHLIWFAGWVIINIGLIPAIKPFDPFPFNFLTLVVSLEAIFLTQLILMSQNRMAKETDKRALLDLQINMLDEQETTLILRILQKVAAHLGLQNEMDDAATELSEQTDIQDVAKTLEKVHSVEK